MDIFTPGTHGSTFGGNPIGSAVAMASLDVLEDEELDIRARELGEYFMSRLREIGSDRIREVRGRGLLVAVELFESAGKARDYCYKLKDRGILAKDTHDTTIRFAPALTVEKADLDWVVEQIGAVLEE